MYVYKIYNIIFIRVRSVAIERVCGVVNQATWCVLNPLPEKPVHRRAAWKVTLISNMRYSDVKRALRKGVALAVWTTTG